MAESPYSAPQSPPSPQPPKSWWQRNWKWSVPAGCGCLVLLVVVVFVVFMALILNFLKASGAYSEAVAKVKANPAVQEALGTPIEEGWFVSGNVSFEGVTGEADLAIPISGPKDKGTIYVLAEKGGAEWAFSTLEVRVKGSGEKIDLVEDGELVE